MTGGVGGVGPGWVDGVEGGTGGTGRGGTSPPTQPRSEEGRVPRSSLRIVGRPHLIPYDYALLETGRWVTNQTEVAE